MARIVGTNSYLGISTDGGSTYTEINNITSIDYSMSINEVDDTDNDDAGWKSNQSGDKQVELGVEANYNSTAGQRACRTAAQAGTLAYFKFQPQVLTGELQMIFQGRVFDYGDSSPHDDVVTVSFTVKSKGAVTESNQT